MLDLVLAGGELVLPDTGVVRGSIGIKDGRIFDFVSRTTPTAGSELNYLSYMFKALKWW